MKKQLATILTCLIISTTALPALAEETTESPSFDLEQVVVTAAKRQQSIKDTPANVAVITGEELKKTGAKTFDDALRLIPGVSVSRPHGIAVVTPQSISIRGIDNTGGVLILVDGISTNKGANDFVNLNIVPIESIEKIEVVKGGYSALYGSNALGGVINIITKSGAGLKVGENRTTARIEYGSFDSSNYKASVQGRGEKTNYSLTLEKNKTNNYFLNNRVYDTTSVADVANIPNSVVKLTARGQAFIERDAYNLDYEGTKFNGKFNYNQNDKSSWNFLLGYSEDEAGNLDCRNLTPRNTKATTSGKEYYYGVNYQNKLDDNKKIAFKLSQTKNKSESFNEAVGGAGVYIPSSKKTDSTVSKAELQLENRISQQHYLTMGVEKTWKEADWTYINTNDNSNITSPPVSSKGNNYAFYLQDEIKLGSRTDMVLGARFDKPEEIDSHFSPKLGLLHKLDESTRLRFNAGHSFNTPSLDQLYSPEWYFRANSVFRSNPNLKPEKVDSYDIGIEKEFSDKVSGSLTYFLNEQKDLITTQEFREGAKTVRLYSNLEASRAKGVEVSLKSKLNKNWSTNFAYTYTDARATKDAFDGKYKDGDRLDDIPLHNAALTVSYTNSSSQGIFNADLITRAISKTKGDISGGFGTVELDGYTIMDLNLNWKNNDGKEVFITINNLANKRYDLTPNILGASRSVLGGVSFSF